MNYRQIYNRLVMRTRPTPEGYTEQHHIIPRCLGGSDKSENLVTLTAKEHYLAHLLLVKIYPGHSGIVKAAMMMVVCSGRGQERITGRRYEWLKILHAKAMSDSQRGEGNSQFGTKWVCNLETQVNKKVSKSQIVEFPWVVGRNKWYQIKAEQKWQQELANKRLAEKDKKIKKLRELYRIYNEVGWEKFKEMTNYPFSQSNLVKTCGRFLPEYKPQLGTKRGQIAD